MLLCLVGFSQQYGPVKQLLLQIGAKKGATGNARMFFCLIYLFAPFSICCIMLFRNPCHMPFRDLSYITSIIFTRVKCNCVRMKK